MLTENIENRFVNYDARPRNITLSSSISSDQSKKFKINTSYKIKFIKDHLQLPVYVLSDSEEANIYVKETSDDSNDDNVNNLNTNLLNSTIKPNDNIAHEPVVFTKPIIEAWVNVGEYKGFIEYTDKSSTNATKKKTFFIFNKFNVLSKTGIFSKCLVNSTDIADLEVVDSEATVGLNKLKGANGKIKISRSEIDSNEFGIDIQKVYKDVVDNPNPNDVVSGDNSENEDITTNITTFIESPIDSPPPTIDDIQKLEDTQEMTISKSQIFNSFKEKFQTKYNSDWAKQFLKSSSIFQSVYTVNLAKNILGNKKFDEFKKSPTYFIRYQKPLTEYALSIAKLQSTAIAQKSTSDNLAEDNGQQVTTANNEPTEVDTILVNLFIMYLIDVNSEIIEDKKRADGSGSGGNGLRRVKSTRRRRGAGAFSKKQHPPRGGKKHTRRVSVQRTKKRVNV